MKLSKRPVFFILVIVFVTVQSILPSCTKEIIKEYIRTDTITQTIIQKDTVIIKDTALTVAILTAHPWKLQETKGLRGTTFVSYVRGAANNSETFDNEYIVFNADKTGLYMDHNGYPAPLTWDFANTGHTKLVYNANFILPGLTTITWDNISYKDGKLRYAQSWTQGTTKSHSYDIRIPR